MNRLRMEIEDQFKRMVDAFAEDRIANDVYARFDLATETSSSFMDGIVMAAAVCGDAPEDLLRLAASMGVNSGDRTTCVKISGPRASEGGMIRRSDLWAPKMNPKKQRHCVIMQGNKDSSV